MKRLYILLPALVLALYGCAGPVKVETGIKLPTPVLLETVATVGEDCVTIQWAPTSNALSGYNCSLSGGRKKFEEITVFPSGSLCTCTIKGLDSGTSYILSVYAVGYTEATSRGRIEYFPSDTARFSFKTKGVYDDGSGDGKEDDDDDDDHGGGGSDTPPSPSGAACRGWFELPAQTDKDKNGIDDNNPDLYYSWTMRADAKSIRNFSSCYSKSMKHPVWVAAPMHRCYEGKSGRSDAYQPDPAIKCTQSSKFEGYTRGHMVGSAERTVSRATNEQAFYYSNIGAQLSSGFNTGGGAWNNLESVVDAKVCSDTLYQVIGCIFETFTDRNGSTIGKKTGAGSFQVPTAWYKVLLRTKKGNSGKRVDQCSADELQCCAFILAHKSNGGHKPNQNDMYTVEEVEKLTGLTFFVNVPNAPKGKFSVSDWL